MIENEVADGCYPCTQYRSGKANMNCLDMIAHDSSFVLGSKMEAVSTLMIQLGFIHLAVSVEKCLHLLSYFLG